MFKKIKLILIGLLAIILIIALFIVITSKPKRQVYVQTLKNNQYRLMVEGKPFLVKGVCYDPIPVGKTNDYDFWSDKLEPWKKDGELMQKMGINTVRFYQAGENLESVKKVVNDLYALYGIHSAMGNWLGFWNYPAPFYDDKDFRDKVKKETLVMVENLKNEKGILCWILGNENNYSFNGKVNSWSSDRIDKLENPRACMLARAQSYYTLVNEIAKEIHKIDPNHPVVMGNGELVCLDTAKEYAPDIDIIGCVIYRGKTFGNIFQSLRKTFDKPLLFIEFGSDSYDAFKKTEDEDIQAYFLESQWVEIYKNLANNPEGAGNCLGGTIFEWNDEWWKHNEAASIGWAVHDTESNWSNGGYYFDIRAERSMNMNEEWFGVVKLEVVGEEKLDKRVPRKAYYVLREFWKKPHLGENLKKTESALAVRDAKPKIRGVKPGQGVISW